MKVRIAETGTNNNDWATPKFILNWIKKNYGLFFDPCPSYGLENNFDGLNIDWGFVNFINPLYGTKKRLISVLDLVDEDE